MFASFDIKPMRKIEKNKEKRETKMQQRKLWARERVTDKTVLVPTLFYRQTKEQHFASQVNVPLT